MTTYQDHHGQISQCQGKTMLIKSRGDPRRCSRYASTGRRQTRAGIKLNNKLLVILLPAVILLAINELVSAEHALSEVWTEGDGLQMKYTTNHDDLLSTRGSEMSLAASQQKQQESADTEAPGTATTSQETNQQEQGGSSPESSDDSTGSGADTESSTSEVPAANPEGSSSESGGGSGGAGEDQGNMEENTDSSKQTNSRVPMAASKQQQSSPVMPSSSSSSSRLKHKQFVSPIKSSAIPSSDDDVIPVREKSKPVFTETPLSYNSALEDSDDGGSETANADHGEDQGYEPSRSEMATGGPQIKFRQPGRLFKEAVKMGSWGSAGNGDADSSSELAEQENERLASTRRKQQQVVPSVQRPKSGSSDDDNNNNNEDDGDSSGVSGGDDDSSSKTTSSSDESGDGDKSRGRQNMIDFDKVVQTHNTNNNDNNNNRKLTQNGGSDSSEDIPEMVNVDQGDERSVPDRHRDDFPQDRRQQPFHRAPEMGPTDGGVNSFNDDDDDAAKPASFRQQPPHRPSSGSFYDHSSRSLASGVTAQRAATGAGRAPNPHLNQAQVRPTAYKNLAYFRGVEQQQLQAAKASPPSPDSERDNFISPGHYPGSMPYLTQAASETSRKELKEPEIGKNAPTAPGSSGGEVPAAAASSVEGQVPQVQVSVAVIAAPSADPTISAAASSREETRSVVRPEPRTSQPSDTSSEINSASASASIGRYVELSQRQQQLLLVTPEPESQPESQQIMAPLLMSTTTMAPLPATGSSSESPAIGATTNATLTAATAANTATTTTATTTSTTSTPAPKSNTTNTSSTSSPSLKRFKFRKYR